MAKFVFSELKFQKPVHLGTGEFIWVWNPDKIPPHLGYSSGKIYHSLTFKTNEVKSVTGMLRKANRLKIPLLWIEIQPNQLKVTAHEAFSSYSKAVAGKSTCLSPIRTVLGMDETIQQLANLLTELKKQQTELAVFALHLDETYCELPDYSVEDIVSRIQELNHAKR